MLRKLLPAIAALSVLPAVAYAQVAAGGGGGGPLAGIVQFFQNDIVRDLALLVVIGVGIMLISRRHEFASIAIMGVGVYFILNPQTVLGYFGW
jgi:type IV secretory pathway VirB2 component (pilin)